MKNKLGMFGSIFLIVALVFSVILPPHVVDIGSILAGLLGVAALVLVQNKQEKIASILFLIGGGVVVLFGFIVTSISGGIDLGVNAIIRLINIMGGRFEFLALLWILLILLYLVGGVLSLIAGIKGLLSKENQYTLQSDFQQTVTPKVQEQKAGSTSGDNAKIGVFMMTHGSHFPSESIPLIQERLSTLDESRFNMLLMQDFKNPTIMFIVSFFAGGLGIDRFLLGQTGLGVAKLLTCGGGGLWTIIDWFLIIGATKKTNLEKFMMVAA